MLVLHRMGGKTWKPGRQMLSYISHVDFFCLFVLVEGDEKACEPSQSFNITWYLRYSDCYNEVFNFGVRVQWKNIGHDF